LHTATVTGASRLLHRYSATPQQALSLATHPAPSPRSQVHGDETYPTYIYSSVLLGRRNIKFGRGAGSCSDAVTHRSSPHSLSIYPNHARQSVSSRVLSVAKWRQTSPKVCYLASRRDPEPFAPLLCPPREVLSRAEGPAVPRALVKIPLAKNSRFTTSPAPARTPDPSISSLIQGTDGVLINEVTYICLDISLSFWSA